MLLSDVPAVVLAPMDGLTDAPMRAVQGEIGAFTYAVSEFVRVSATVLPGSMFRRDVPELLHGARTPSGLPVQVQLLGGHAERMAQSAHVACRAGATAIDINFGCPAPTVNNHDGGATLLKHPQRIREIVAAVRGAVPPEVPVSAKLRLGWDSEDAILENAQMAAEGGASWLAIHGRTREQGYRPPALWWPIGLVRERVNIPVVANGDLWSLEAFRRCREETGCIHFMLGRGALANPALSHQVAAELGLIRSAEFTGPRTPSDWQPYLERLIRATVAHQGSISPRHMVCRLKQWLRLASAHGDFPLWDTVKRADSVEEIFGILEGGVPGIRTLSAEAMGAFGGSRNDSTALVLAKW
jgi:tRNA-dihydrouridine synthase C